MQISFYCWAKAGVLFAWLFFRAVPVLDPFSFQVRIQINWLLSFEFGFGFLETRIRIQFFSRVGSGSVFSSESDHNTFFRQGRIINRFSYIGSDQNPSCLRVGSVSIFPVVSDSDQTFFSG